MNVTSPEQTPYTDGLKSSGGSWVGEDATREDAGMITPQHGLQAGHANFGSEEIPDELKRRPQWVVWRFEHRSGKPTKVPYDPKTGVLAKTTDLMTWGTFDEALKSLDLGRYSGMGFVFCSADPFTGVDLDKCRDSETGELTPAARDIVDDFRGAYVEVSPSGTGVHIIVRGKLPEKGKRRGWIEVYSQDRYFTVTGRAL